MMRKVNYLLGSAEKLVKRIPPPKMKPDKAHPYTLERAIKRVVPKMTATARAIAETPPEACPNDESVALVTLHPAYLAKSYFPDDLLNAANLWPVGSRSRTVTPDAWAISSPPESALTAELFVAGKRSDFAKLPQLVRTFSEESGAALDIRKIEDMRSYPAAERIRTKKPKSESPFWEVILHANALDSDYILEGFREYLEGLDVEVDLDSRLHAQGLCFLPVRIPTEQIGEVAKFSFLRAARVMPRMRPVVRVTKASPSFKYTLPDVDAIDPTIRVAVYDGGMPANGKLDRWVTRKKVKDVGEPHDELVEHGLGVTSALLFGPLEEGVPLPQPYSKVDHIRVLDKNSDDDDSGDYFDIIKRIKASLDAGNYQFANFSLGPDLPIEDDDVHVWTAVLDQHLKDGTLLASIAAGNTGDKDHASGNARIQSPADCVNGLSVGSADCTGDGWKRASHSSIGPGRSPGVVKPDVLSFGGCSKSPFYVIGTNGHAVGRIGTSFASPAALRAAIGVRAHLGSALTPLALKSLLIHQSDQSEHPREEIGWGRIPESLEQIITSDDTTAHIVYQGKMEPGAWMRATIPVPEEAMKGMVELRATICFATGTDPQDPIHYTRSGLEVRFRPHSGKRKNPKQKEADSKSFFNAESLYAGESELRSDAHKWETTLHARTEMRGSSFLDPVFDIHYNARTGGRKAGTPPPIAYALIVSVHAGRVPDLYDRIFRRYRTILEAMKPVIEIPLLGA